MALFERAIRIVLRLHPPSFRRRFGREVESTVRESMLRKPGRRRALFVLADLTWTLARAWSGEIAAALGRAPAGTLGLAARALHDARFALRGLRRAPGQGLVMVATLALAIGANASVFTVSQALLLRALPYDAPERIVRVRGGGLEQDGELHPMLEAVARFHPDGGANLVEGSASSRIRISQVSGPFFQVLGADPMFGPGLPSGRAEEDAAIVLGHALWVQAFGADPAVVGQTVILSGVPLRIAGVAPPDVEFPGRTQAWVSGPLRFEFYGLAVANYAVARAAEGVRVSDLEADLHRRARERMRDSELSEELWLPVLTPLQEELTASVRLPLIVLSGAAGLVLLLGCLNVAGIGLARLWSREDEMDVRRALGAGRTRVLGQLLVEASVLAVLGGALSLVLARAGVPLLRALLPAETPGLAGVEAGTTLVLSVGVATLAAGILAGIVPALASTGRGGVVAGGGRATHDRRTSRLQGSLAVAQLALAVLLVTGATLLGQSLRRLHDVPVGFDAEALTFEVSLPPSAYPDGAAREAYRRRLGEAIAAIPGVAAVGASSRLPLMEGLSIGARLRLAEWPPEESVPAGSAAVSAAYFEAMGIPLLEGAGFGGGAPSGDREVILGQSLARALFPDGGAVGRTVDASYGPEPVPSLVVAVVGDVRARGPEQEPGHLFYERLDASPRALMGFAVRSERGSEDLAGAVHSAAARVDRTVPVFRLRTTGEAIASTLAARRAVALVSALFGAGAALLAGLGVYGVVAQGVARRRRELGIRLALGAEAADLVRSTLAGGLRLTAAGVLAGTAAALFGTRLIEGLLFGIGSGDPGTLAAVATGLAIVALVASYLPARRAARADPLDSLRAD